MLIVTASSIQRKPAQAVDADCGTVIPVSYVQVLILDEISMISAEMFNALEQMARDLRASLNPFGGIQLILAGDFFQ